MTGRVLNVAVCGSGEAGEIAKAISDRATQMFAEGPDAPSLRVQHVPEAGEGIAAAHHLVVSTDGARWPWFDVVIMSVAEAEMLTEGRLVPWASRWAKARRAPRGQVAVLAEPDPSWAPTAQRLITRLHNHISDPGMLRIDHIGSTSVEGLPAKNLIDIQVTVRSDDLAVSIAEAATGAGFVHVAGEWHGKDRFGGLHPEQVCVDADPGRPVNVNIRSADRPVARDALLFRDWLRASPDARKRYLALKSGLAGQQVDDYGDGKETFISAALSEADTWASATGWTLERNEA